MYSPLKQSIRLVCLVFAALLAVGCDVDTSSSDSGSSSSGSSTSGTAFVYGGYDYPYTCSFTGVSNTAPIPPTISSSCETTYERYAAELSCNEMDQASYNALVSDYQSCLNQEIAACEASPSDPNCTG